MEESSSAACFFMLAVEKVQSSTTSLRWTALVHIPNTKNRLAPVAKRHDGINLHLQLAQVLKKCAICYKGVAVRAN